MTTVAQKFGKFAAGLDAGAVPAGVRHAAKRCLVDWWGGMLAGSVEAPATVLVEALAPGTGPARLLPSGRGTDARTAALINGTAAHTVEVDDIYSPALYHPGVAVIVAVMAGGVDPTEVERVEVGTYRAGVEICGNTDPATPYEAKFSLPYTVALAALKRPVDLAAFAPERLHDPELRAMMARIRVALAPEAEGAFPALRAAEVAITTRDGQVRWFRQPTRRGDPDFPVSDADLGAKFRMLAVPVIGMAAAEVTAAALWRVDELTSVAAVPTGAGA